MSEVPRGCPEDDEYFVYDEQIDNAPLATSLLDCISQLNFDGDEAKEFDPATKLKRGSRRGSKSLQLNDHDLGNDRVESSGSEIKNQDSELIDFRGSAPRNIDWGREGGWIIDPDDDNDGNDGGVRVPVPRT